MDKRVPIILLTGFLGAGKTTFLNWLITHHRTYKVSIVLNEYGDVALESHFVKKEGILVSEISNGCMCCVAKGDIPRVIHFILDKSPDTQYIFIEASGLSDPEPVRSVITGPEISDNVRLDINVCIVDAVNFIATREEHSIINSQIGDSDVIILNKSHLAGKDVSDKITSQLKAMLPSARILDFDKGLNPAVFLDIPHSKIHNPNSPSNLSHKHLHEQYNDLFIKLDCFVDLQKIATFFRYLDNSVIRAKGFFCLRKDDGGVKKILVSAIAGRYEIVESNEKCEDLVRGACVFIGKNLSEEILEKQLKDCQIEPE